ncbi:MAG: carbohydrate binding family 9 domain-containing protein, partial [Prolixibacteraceae bacterium]|nr:carbohydrate binding family 9 domain-containing protein [Prolixibacteraceae bacterium]
MKSKKAVFLREIFIQVVIVNAILFMSTSLFAQESERSISVKFTDENINLDGVLDEASWQTADKGGDFWQYFPTDTTLTKLPTEFKLLYNDHFLYIGIRGEAASDKYVVSSLRRDFRGTTSDNVTLMFDTFKDGNTAFLFGMTPYGVQREAFISQGGAIAGFNPNWDQKWQLESKMYDGYFIFEAAIPFSSIKFREGETEWRVQCYRWDIGINEQSAR